MSELARIQAIKELLTTLNRAGVRSRRVLEAIAAVPREEFVDPGLQFYAWQNRALPISEHQTISQPLVVALMTQALDLSGHESVLEIGTGSGYQTALLCRLAGRVISIERHQALAEQAARRLGRLGFQNVQIVVADGSQGWPAGAPYDRIIVTAAAPNVPPPLLEQLALTDGVRLVIPVGTLEEQDLIVVERQHGVFVERNLGAVRFVPLIGEQGHHLEEPNGDGSG